MSGYEELVAGVRARAALPGAEEARAAITATIGTLSHCLSDDERVRLAESLPPIVAGAAAEPAPTVVPDPASAAAEVGRRVGATPERGRYLTQAVLSALSASVPDAAALLRERLPEEFVELFTPPAGAPDLPGSAGAGRPAVLTDEQVATALRDLPGWNGNRRCLRRGVELPADRIPALCKRIKAIATDQGRHVGTGRQGDTVTFTLFTNAVGAVTADDVEMARRIDEEIDRVGSSG